MSRTLQLAALACLLAPAPVAAQNPAAEFLDHVEVRVAEIDVVVLDRDGNPVRGLGRDDFELFEDGKPVEIANFLAYDEEITRPDAGEAAPAVAPAEPAAAGPGAVEPPGTEAAPPANWLVYLDQERLPPSSRAQVLRQLASFLASGARPGDRFLVATYDGAALKIVAPLTTDAAAVAGGLQQLQKRAGFASALDGRRALLQRQILSVDTGAREAAMEAEALLGEIDRLAEEEAVRGREQVRALRDLLALASGVEGRVAVLAAGAGFESRPGEALYRLWDSRFASLAGRNRADRELDQNWAEVGREYAKLLAAINGGRFTFYTVQAGDRGPEVSAETPGAAGEAMPGAGDHGALRGGSSLAGLSGATGGRTFVAAPDLARRLATARRDLVTYYSLGYHPQGDEPGRRRRIEVRVRPPGLEVRTRAEVTDPSADDRLSDAAVAALLGPAEGANPMAVALEIEPQKAPASKRGGALVGVLVRVPIARVTLLPDGARHRGRLVFQFALEDPDGGFRRLESRPLAFDVPNEKLTQAITQSVSFRVEIALAPGHHLVAAAVLDELAGTLSTATGPVTVAGR